MGMEAGPGAWLNRGRPRERKRPTREEAKGKEERAGWLREGVGPSGQIEEKTIFSNFQILFHFVFKTKFNFEPNQIQIEFQIYFSTPIKISYFGKFSKNKFYNFLNPFIFKFSFLLFQSHF